MRRIALILTALAFSAAGAAAAAEPAKKFRAWPPQEDTPAGAEMRASLADAGRIAFATNRDKNWEIYSVNADGTDIKNLTNHPGRDAYPRWSADGKKIVFWSDRDGPPMPGPGGVPPLRRGKGMLYIMDADGSNQKRVARGTHGAFSPDGKVLAFRRGSRIWLRGVEAGREVAVSPRSWRNATMPVFSPDARHLLFIINTRHWDVVAVPVDPAAGYVTHPNKHWIVSTRKGCNPEFLPPTADRIIHVVDLARDTESGFVTVPFVSHKKQKAIEIKLGWDAPSWNYFPDPSPDGKHLAYSHGPGYKHPAGGERGWEMTKNMELVVRRFSDGETIWLTKTGKVNRDPDWFDSKLAPRETEAE